MSRVIHFEIHADNPERAIAFYSGLFGWQFKKWEGPMLYWLITTGPDSDEPYGEDALQLVFSTTKGATAACAL